MKQQRTQRKTPEVVSEGVVPALTVAAMAGGACGPMVGATLGEPLPMAAIPFMALLAGVVGLAMSVALLMGESLAPRMVNAAFMAGGAWAVLMVGFGVRAAGLGGAIAAGSAAVMVSVHHLAQRAGAGIAAAHLYMLVGVAGGGLVGSLAGVFEAGLAMGGLLGLLQYYGFFAASYFSSSTTVPPDASFTSPTPSAK